MLTPDKHSAVGGGGSQLPTFDVTLDLGARALLLFTNPHARAEVDREDAPLVG
jgi:hypothetical protein